MQLHAPRVNQAAQEPGALVQGPPSGTQTLMRSYLV